MSKLINNPAWDIMYSDLRVQLRSADSWVYAGRRDKDKSAIRNAAFAVGLAAGMLKTIYDYLRSIDEPVPDYVIEDSEKCDKIWSEVGSW